MNNLDEKKEFNKFLTQIVLSGVLVFAVFFSLRFFGNTGSTYQEALTSLIICSLNVIAGTRFILIGLKKNNSGFMSVVLGSLVIRMFILVGFVVTGLLIVGFDASGFIISLFSFYFVFLIIELIFLFKITKQKS